MLYISPEWLGSFIMYICCSYCLDFNVYNVYYWYMYTILIVVKKIKYLYKHCMTKRGEFVANVNDLLRSFHFN